MKEEEGLTQLVRKLVAENSHRGAEAAGQTLGEGSSCGADPRHHTILSYFMWPCCVWDVPDVPDVIILREMMVLEL